MRFCVWTFQFNRSQLFCFSYDHLRTTGEKDESFVFFQRCEKIKVICITPMQQGKIALAKVNSRTKNDKDYILFFIVFKVNNSKTF